jgi:hypothetical protein
MYIFLILKLNIQTAIYENIDLDSNTKKGRNYLLVSPYGTGCYFLSYFSSHVI